MFFHPSFSYPLFRLHIFSPFHFSCCPPLFPPTASLQNRSTPSWTKYSANNYIWQSLNVRTHKPMTKSPWTTGWEFKTIKLSNQDRELWMTLQDHLHRKPSSNDIFKKFPGLLYGPRLNECVIKYIFAVILTYKIFYEHSATATLGRYW